MVFPKLEEKNGFGLSFYTNKNESKTDRGQSLGQRHLKGRNIVEEQMTFPVFLHHNREREVVTRQSQMTRSHAPSLDCYSSRDVSSTRTVKLIQVCRLNYTKSYQKIFLKYVTDFHINIRCIPLSQAAKIRPNLFATATKYCLSLIASGHRGFPRATFRICLKRKCCK